jgi:hypothetical protein
MVIMMAIVMAIHGFEGLPNTNYRTTTAAMAGESMASNVAMRLVPAGVWPSRWCWIGPNKKHRTAKHRNPF